MSMKEFKKETFRLVGSIISYSATANVAPVPLLRCREQFRTSWGIAWLNHLSLQRLFARELMVVRIFRASRELEKLSH